MQTYFKWLTRILILLAIMCAVFAGWGYFNKSPDGLDGGGAIAVLYTAIVGALGFSVTAFATHLIGRNFGKK